MGRSIGSFVVAVVALAGAPFPVVGAARATEVVLQNDTCNNKSCNVDVGAGLVVGEGVAETFQPPPDHYPFKLKRVQFVAANPSGGGQSNLTFKVYEDAGQAAPGAEIASVTTPMPYQGSTMYVGQIDLPPMVVVKGAVRLAVFPDVDTAKGGLTVPSDPKAKADARSTVCANLPTAPCTWKRASELGVKGTWVVRLVIDTAAPVMADGGVAPDGGGGGGDMAVAGTGGTPVVESITPSRLAAAATERSAIVKGRGFAGGAIVRLDGAPGPVTVANVLVMDAETLRLTVPRDVPPAVYDVLVQNPTGAPGRLAGGFEVTGAASSSGCALGGGAAAGASTGALLVVGAALLAALALVGRARQRRDLREPAATGRSRDRS